jgi:hypothetical protein
MLDTETNSSALVAVEHCAGSGRLPARQLGWLWCVCHLNFIVPYGVRTIVDTVVLQLNRKTGNDFLWTFITRPHACFLTGDLPAAALVLFGPTWHWRQHHAPVASADSSLTTDNAVPCVVYFREREWSRVLQSYHFLQIIHLEETCFSKLPFLKVRWLCRFWVSGQAGRTL